MILKSRVIFFNESLIGKVDILLFVNFSFTSETKFEYQLNDNIIFLLGDLARNFPYPVENMFCFFMIR